MLGKDEPGFFSVPNELVDICLPKLGAECCAVYLCLARQVSGKHYPSLTSLAASLRRKGKVDQIFYQLKRLEKSGLIKDWEIDAIKESEEIEQSLLEEEEDG